MSIRSIENGQDIVDLDFLKKFVAEGYAECWTPKPAFKQGCKVGEKGYVKYIVRICMDDVTIIIFQ